MPSKKDGNATDVSFLGYAPESEVENVEVANHCKLDRLRAFEPPTLE